MKAGYFLAEALIQVGRPEDRTGRAYLGFSGEDNLLGWCGAARRHPDYCQAPARGRHLELTKVASGLLVSICFARSESEATLDFEGDYLFDLLARLLVGEQNV